VTAIFLSYRRSDTSGYAGRLADALEKRFGKSSVFQDIEAIAPGSNFQYAIDTAIAQCEVVLVLIGDTWSAEQGADGTLRLDDPRDFVRLEVTSALRAGKPVLPVLVEGAKMPAEHTLPADLKTLSRLQGLELSDSRWDYDLDRLAGAIRKLTGGRPERRRRRMLVLAGSGAVIGTLAALSYVKLSRPADVSGRWNLPNGSFWIVVQDGPRLAIEETHYQSKEVWKRGSGTVQKDRVHFALDIVHGAPRRYEGDLRLSSDRNTLSGEVRDASSGRKESLALMR
jgi:hypothetical protein